MRKDHATDTVGWMTKEQIGKLNDISDANPRFTVLTDALVIGLPQRPHELPAMANLGELQYWYEHNGLVHTTQANEVSVKISGSAAKDQSSYASVTDSVDT